MNRHRRRAVDIDALPEAYKLVISILADGGEMTREELVRRAAAVGIGEAELHEVLYGRAPPDKHLTGKRA